VGRKQLKSASVSVTGMRLAAARLNRRQPQTVVVISPHSPRMPGHFGLWSDSRLSGSFSRFGAPLVGLEFLNDLALVAELKVQARRVGIPTWEINSQPLDHGALVPLWYVAEEGWRGPTAVLSLNYPGEGCLRELGRALHRAASRLGRRIAVIASGDLSHRLTLDAPAGYEPRARDFDAEFIGCLRQGAYRDLEKIDPKLRNLAGEDALDSTLVAVAAANWEATGHEVLSYEGPFGVGYGVAILLDSEIAAGPSAAVPLAEQCHEAWARMLPWVARQSLKAALFETGEQLPSTEDDCLGAQRGVFVTINQAGVGHRGCAGTVSPVCQNVVAETRYATRSAAFGDPRFPPVTGQEFSNLRLEVSVIEPVEDVTSNAALDPDRFGVLVSAADGRRGCLLPGLPEVRSSQQQLDLARRKAGIGPAEPVRLQRFRTNSFQEVEPSRPGGVMFRPVLRSSHPADWWMMLPDGRIECRVCPRLCKLQEGQRGFCFVRQRVDNHLVLTTYGYTSGFCVDPIEKKPLHHFYPGTSVLSFGTAGCNLGCLFCQNWDISKVRDSNRLTQAASPEAIAKTAQKLGCKAVAFTYNDPVIFAEYAIDVALACHAVGIQTVAVTAGYMNSRPRTEFYQHMDAANVDLKGFTDEFYHKLCLGRLAPVLETLEYLRRETKVWLEVTSLLIPGENDDERHLHWAAEWFVQHLGPDVPWHFTAFHPDFRLLDRLQTPLVTLEKAREIARSKGLRYVYTGNVQHAEGSSTWCPQCQRVLIARNGYELGAWNLKQGCCRFCGRAIAGRFDDQPGAWRGRCMSVTLSS